MHSLTLAAHSSGTTLWENARPEIVQEIAGHRVPKLGQQPQPRTAVAKIWPHAFVLRSQRKQLPINKKAFSW